MRAPALRSGSTIHSIGLLRSSSLPSTSNSPGVPARSPIRIRAVVAELRASSFDVFSRTSPRKPRPPTTMDESLASQISTPSWRRMERLASMSSDCGMLRMVLVPSARAAAKAARWASDLSPGGVQEMRGALAGSSTTVIGTFLEIFGGGAASPGAIPACCDMLLMTSSSESSACFSS